MRKRKIGRPKGSGNKCGNSIVNPHYNQTYEKTGRYCVMCGEEIIRVFNCDGICIFDNWFYCHKELCQKAYEYRGNYQADLVSAVAHV